MNCFDLRRAVETAELAFGGRRLVVVDARLREVDYGALTRRRTPGPGSGSGGTATREAASVAV